jgi:hypothetical protein
MDKEAAAQQIAAITKSLEDVQKDLRFYVSAIENGTGTDLESIGEVSSTHTNLIASVRNLNRSARGPVDMVFAQIEAVCLCSPVEMRSVGMNFEIDKRIGSIHRCSSSAGRDGDLRSTAA